MASKIRKEDLAEQLRTFITDERVMQAFMTVPRELFVPKTYQHDAYSDMPLPLLAGQTISQPTTVLLMTQFLQVKEGQKILEIGTGSGYQAAILSVLVGPKGKVITTEIIPELYAYAKERLKSYKNVQVILTDGSQGYPKEASYDRIILTAASPRPPLHLLAQLKPKGLLLSPVGESSHQRMLRITKQGEIEDLGGFLFVPLTGKYGFQGES